MRKIRWAFTLPAILLPFIFIATPAFGLEMEYYTYGGFRPIVQAFTKVALIFSDPEYNGLLFVVMVLGLIAGCTAFILRAATGAKIVPLVWAVPVILGAVVYLALFVPKGKITIYDTVYNRFETVGNVPDGIIFTAGFLNTIERGFIDIVDTAGAPDSYQKTAGGLGFKALQNIRSSLPKNANVKNSTNRYIKDCVAFELHRPGTDLSLDTLRNSTSNFLDDLEEASTPALFTVYYDDTTKEGKTVTCKEAWTSLRTIYNNYGGDNYKESLKKICGKTHFNPDETSEMNQCKELIRSTLTRLTGTDTEPELIVQQQQIAEMLYKYFFTHDPEMNALVLGNKEIVSKGIGIGLMMNEWIPIIRAIMTAIAIGIIPFLVIFMFTPVSGKALSVMFGFFVFLTTWGITDAIIHGAAMDYASYAFEDMKQSALGVYGMIAMPELAVKQMTMFGVIRSAGLMLASFFSMMLIKFGGHALAMMASNLTSMVQGGGAQGGRMLDVDGATTEMSKELSAFASMDVFAEHRFTNIGSARAFDMHKNIGAYNVAKTAQQHLQGSGNLPAGMTDGQLGQAVAGANVSVAGDNGKNTMTISSGQVAFNTAEGMEDEAHVRTTTNAEGSGIQTDDLPSGQAVYSVNNGQTDLKSANIKNLNPVTLTQAARKQLVSSASRSLGSSDNFNETWNQMEKDSIGNQEAKTFRDEYSKNLKEGLTQAFSDSSRFSETLSNKDMSTLRFGLGISNKKDDDKGLLAYVGKLLGARGDIDFQLQKEDGKQVSIDMDQKTAADLSKVVSEVSSEAMAKTITETQSLDYAAGLAKNVGLSDAYQSLTNAQNFDVASSSYGADLETALVKNYAMEQYGDISPYSIRRTINDLNSLTTQGSQGIDKLHGIVDNFMKGGGYNLGATGGAVDSTISDYSQHIKEQSGLADRGNAAAAQAAGTTGGISEAMEEQKDLLNQPIQTNPDGGKDITDTVSQRKAEHQKMKDGEGELATDIAGLAINKFNKEQKNSILYKANKDFFRKLEEEGIKK